MNNVAAFKECCPKYVISGETLFSSNVRSIVMSKKLVTSLKKVSKFIQYLSDKFVVVVNIFIRLADIIVCIFCLTLKLTIQFC